MTDTPVDPERRAAAKELRRLIKPFGDGFVTGNTATQIALPLHLVQRALGAKARPDAPTDLPARDPAPGTAATFRRVNEPDRTATWRAAWPLGGKGWYDNESGAWLGTARAPQHLDPEPADG